MDGHSVESFINALKKPLNTPKRVNEETEDERGLPEELSVATMPLNVQLLVTNLVVNIGILFRWSIPV